MPAVVPLDSAFAYLRAARRRCHNTVSLTSPPILTPAPHPAVRVWWMRLGIQHQRIHPGRPQQNGAHERMLWSIFFNTVLIATVDERDYIIRG